MTRFSDISVRYKVLLFAVVGRVFQVKIAGTGLYCLDLANALPPNTKER